MPTVVRLEQLTAQQEALLPVIRDEWLRVGICTDRADRAAAEAGVAAAYRAAGLEPPRFVMWLGSPMAGCIGAALLAGPGAWWQFDDDVWDYVWVQVREIPSPLQEQVGDQIRDQIRDQVRLRYEGMRYA